MKKSLAVMLALIMVLCMIPTTALAASWKPDDKITITVDVYDKSTNQIYRNVGTDTVTKGNENIQSNNYKIPALSKFTDAQYGRVEEVTGDWLPTYSSCNVGTNVAFSCNSNNARITYWVDYFTTGGSGTGGSSSEDIDLGGNGKNTIKFSLVYHSNYPDGTDYTVTKNYTVKSYVKIYNVFSNQFLSYTDCGFGGYTPKSTEKTWYTTKACTQTCGNIGAENGKTYDLYAGWKNGSGEPATPVTVTYKDGSETLATVNALSGDTVTAIDCPKTKQGYTFKGWDITPAATTVVYNYGDNFVVTSSITLYAVWEENNPTPPTTDKPEPPKPENTPGIPGLTGAEVVEVKCIENSVHETKKYTLLYGGYTVGDVKDDAASGYTCDITVKPDKYVEAYNTDISVDHTLAPAGQTGTIHLKYDKEAQKWQLANPSGVPVVFNVKCDNTQPPLDTITIEVSKVWDDDSNKPDQITVLLLANGKEVDRDTIRPDNEDTWFHRFNDMPKNDSNGNLINYTVKEENVPAGWTPYYWTADKLIFRIHNVPTENTREIKVTKTVSGDGADKAKYFDFKVTLLQDLDGNGEIGDGTHPLSDTYTFGGEATFKLKHGESFTITGIPSHVQYLPLQYKVEEIAPSGYTVKVNGSAGSSINGAFTDAKTVEINFENIKESGTNPTPTPTPTPTPGGGNGGGGHWHPTTTPVPVIVIPPKTGDMTIWQSILHFLGIR